jgi:hypothetical protein
VLGVEGDIGATNARGVHPCPNGFFYNCQINIDWLSTVTALVGLQGRVAIRQSPLSGADPLLGGAQFGNHLD